MAGQTSACRVELDSGAQRHPPDEPTSGVFLRPLVLQRLPDVAPRLPAKDAAEYRWYLRSEDPLVGIGETSFSSQLERAAVLVRGSKPCRKCGGSAKTWRPGTGFSPAAGGSYRTALMRMQHREWKRLRAELERSGKTMPVGLRPSDLFSELPALLCKTCANCRGVGWVERKFRRRHQVTARPTGSSKHGSTSSVQLNDVAIARFGKVSRRERLVCGVSPLAAAVLKAYYWPGREESITNIWPLTETGQRLLADNLLKADPLEYFHNEREVQRTKPSFQRGADLAACAREAPARFAHACEVWNSFGPLVQVD